MKAALFKTVIMISCVMFCSILSAQFSSASSEAERQLRRENGRADGMTFENGVLALEPDAGGGLRVAISEECIPQDGFLLKADVEFPKVDAKGHAGFLIRRSNGKDCYVHLTPQGTYLGLSGAGDRLLEKTLPACANGKHTLEIRAEKDTVEVSVDGKKYVSADKLSGGIAGIAFMTFKAPVRYSGVTVTPLAVPMPSALIQECLAGDFHVLHPDSANLPELMVFQYSLPAKGCGLLQVCRAEKCRETDCTVTLLALDADALYEVRDLEGKMPARTCPGVTLMTDGIELSVPTLRKSLFFFYCKASETPASAKAAQSAAAQSAVPALSAKKLRTLGVIGNSLTRHSPSDSIGWHGNWGMAATCEEKDFCHVLLGKLNRKYAKSLPHPVELQILNGAIDEIHLARWDVEPAKDADILVIQIGANFRRWENFDPEKHFISRYEQMLRDFRKSRPDQLIVCVSSFGDSALSGWIETACQRVGVGYADIDAIGDNPENRAKSEGHFSNAGVNWHPGDRGMEAIAEAIFETITTNMEE